jgi:hypothetical protein
MPPSRKSDLGSTSPSFDQAKSMVQALYRGDPAAPEILRHSFAELVEEYIPRR